LNTRSSLLIRGLIPVAVAILLLAAGAGSAFAEVTGAADNLRTGWYPHEPSLTPSFVTSPSFKLAFEDHLQGQIYAQPLTADGTLVVATEDNWVYGLDPNSGAIRWAKQFGTPVNSVDPRINCEDLSPHIGITGTPVIDTEHGIVYFVSNQYVSGNIVWYMHAVSLGNGQEVPNFPVEIKGEAQNIPGLEFRPEKELQRPGLLMMNGVVYAGFGSHCDNPSYQGWIAGVSTSGVLTTMWASSPKGGSIWQSGGGLISDGPGQILFSTGNASGAHGEGDPSPGPGNAPPSALGQSVVRVAVQSNQQLKATDFFSPFNNAILDETDFDLGSATPIALPYPYFGTAGIHDLLVQPSKRGDLYILNRDNLGGMGSTKDEVLQKLGPYGGVWDGSAVWPGDGGYVYIPGVSPAESGGTGGGAVDKLRFFKYGVDGKGVPTLSVAAESKDGYWFGSGSPIVTSNGTEHGSSILWTTQCPVQGCGGAKLRAYTAVPSEKLAQPLWEAPIGLATKFSRPDACNGHIYVGNREGVVFGYGVPAPSAPGPSTATTDCPTAEGGAVPGSGEGSPSSSAQLATPVTIGVAAKLSHLRVRLTTTKGRHPRREAVVTYTLSAAGTVQIAIDRRVTVHRCRRGVHTCFKYVATKIKLKTAGHAGNNTVHLSVAALSVGGYRLLATPLAPSGTRGVTREVDFNLPKAAASGARAPRKG
jgi:PQQ-like domain